jgi:hypothetical protein
MILVLGAYFDQAVDGVVPRLVGEQLEDGGWNCELENGSARSSFHSTIRVLEGLLAHERATGGSSEAIAARRRGEEYLLERKLFRRDARTTNAGCCQSATHARVYQVIWNCYAPPFMRPGRPSGPESA